MLHRRPTALAALMLAVLPATLSACGFHLPTDRLNAIAAGINDRSSTVDVLGVRVLSSERGQGRLIGSLANNTDQAAKLVKVTVAGGEVTTESFKPVTIPGDGSVNLAQIAPIRFTGDFVAGEVLPDVELTFSAAKGETPQPVDLDVPVVKPCFQYTQVPTPSEAPSSSTPAKGAKGKHAGTSSSTASTSSTASATGASESTSGSASGTASESASAGSPSSESATAPSSSETASASSSESESSAVYACTPAEPTGASGE